MAVSALIQFTQGALVGVAGQALMGAVAPPPVVVANGGNAIGVIRSTFALLAVPGGSAVPPTEFQDGPLPTAQFNPDIPGGYTVQLTVYDAAGNSSTDVRVFGVLELSGRFIPPQYATDALLDFGAVSGFPSVNTRGWSVFMEAWLRFLDARGAGVGLDDGNALRTRRHLSMRRNESAALRGSKSEAWNLYDGGELPFGKVGVALTTVGDYAYFNDAFGGVYGVSITTGYLINKFGPVFSCAHRWQIVDLVGTRHTPSGNVLDCILIVQRGDPSHLGRPGGFLTFIDTSDNYYPSWYRDADVTTLPAPATPVRACYVGGGDATLPQYAITASDGKVYITDTALAPHAAYDSGGDTPTSLFMDDLGFLWVAFTTSNTVRKFSVNLATPALTLVVTCSMDVAPVDIVSDGRRARALGIHNVGAVSTLKLYGWDLLTAQATPTLPLAVQQPGTPFAYPSDLYYDGTNVWVADPALNALPAYNATTKALAFAPDVSAVFEGGANRVVGNGTLIAACSGTPGDESQNIAIIDRATGALVGTLGTGHPGGSSFFQDIAWDASGNLYAVFVFDSGGPAPSVVVRWNAATIAAATPTSFSVPDVGSNLGLTRYFWSVCFVPSTGFIYVGENNGSGTSSLYQLNASTLVETGLSYLYAGDGDGLNRLLCAFGSIWGSTWYNDVVRVDPTTLALIADVNVGTYVSWGLAADTIYNTVLVGDDDQEFAARIDPATNTVADTFGSGFSRTYWPVAVMTPSGIWITEQYSSPSSGDVPIYSSGIGTETQTDVITTIPQPFTTARMGYDGEAIYLAFPTPSSGSRPD